MPSPRPCVAAALTVLAAATRATAAVEIGTGTGVTGLSLLDGMSEGGILTSIDADAGRQRAAKSAFGDAQVRLIAGAPEDVLPRLADEAYDIVLINEASDSASAFLEQALRLLRTGGAVAFTDATAGGSTIDPGQRDPKTQAARSVAQQVKENETLQSALLPIGDGLLVAVKA